MGEREDEAVRRPSTSSSSSTSISLIPSSVSSRDDATIKSQNIHYRDSEIRTL